MTVLDRLEKTLFQRPAHAMLREVRNATGYQGVTRTADALVVSLWPSRGIWFACVEVKVSRSDWLRELKQPAKAEEISQFCEYMWIAATPGVVEMHEVPKAWGYVEVQPGKVKVHRQAPARQTQPLTAGFVAAVLRNRADYESGLIGRIKDELRRDTIAEGKTQAAPDEVLALEREVKQLKRQLEEHQAMVTTFEKASGVQLNRWSGARLGEAFTLAGRLQRLELEQIAKQLESITKQLRAADAELKETRAMPSVDCASSVGGAHPGDVEYAATQAVLAYANEETGT